MPGRERLRRGQAGDVAQPLSAMTYTIIAFIGIAAAVATGIFIANDPVRLAGVWFLCLIPISLGAAAFLFGAMRSYAIWNGNQLGGRLEIGGPVVVAAGVLLLGMNAAPVPASLSLNIRFENQRSEPVGEGTGKVSLIFQDVSYTEDIGSNGRAYFSRLPANVAKEKAKLSLAGAPFELVEPSRTYDISRSDTVAVVREKPKSAKSLIEVQYLVASTDAVLDIGQRRQQILSELGTPFFLKSDVMSEIERRTDPGYKSSNGLDIQRIVCFLIANTSSRLIDGLKFFEADSKVAFESAAIARGQRIMACSELIGYPPAASITHKITKIAVLQDSQLFDYTLPPVPPREKMLALNANKNAALGAPPE
jgi:hypothetical protein